jgi:tetratricopeptide (TPR) repeat protein
LNPLRSPAEHHSRRASSERWLTIFLLIAITVATYFPILSHQFADWDDSKLIRAVWKPSWERAWRIVTDFDLTYSREVYYSPIHLLSLMADQAVVGRSERPQAWIAKLVNVGLHAANTWLVFTLLLMIGVGTRAAFIASLVFALHPIQVGTVAWITERKNLLATFCYVGSLVLFIKYLRAGGPSRLLAVTLLFVAGILSKPSSVTLPLVLLTLVPLVAPGGRPSNSPVRGVALLLGVLFVMAFAWGIFVLSTERTYSWVLPAWPYRPLIAAGAIWFYVSKFIVPVGLVPLYPRWDVEHELGWFVLLLIALLTAAGLVIYFRNRIDRWILWGILFFLINILLVSGLIPFGYMTHSFVADHFLYLPMVGLAVCVARLIDIAYGRSGAISRYSTILTIGLYVWVCLLGIAAVRQTWMWKDPTSMWEATLKVNKGSFVAYNNYGLVAMASGDYPKALSLFQKAVELAPRQPVPRKNIAWIYLQLGDTGRARELYASAAALNPRDPSAPAMLGALLRKESKLDEAIEFLRKSVTQLPGSGLLREELGIAYHAAGLEQEALAAFQKATKVEPLRAAPYMYQAAISISHKDFDRGIALLERSLSLAESAEARNLLGVAYARTGQTGRALEEFQRAFKLQPALLGITDNVANTLMDLGRYEAAREFCVRAEKSGRPCLIETLKRLDTK